MYTKPKKGINSSVFGLSSFSSRIFTWLSSAFFFVIYLFDLSQQLRHVQIPKIPFGIIQMLIHVHQ